MTAANARGLDSLLAEIRACTVCAAELPLGPRPMVRAAAGARLLIVGQAPGTLVHETGIPFNDPSGERLRDWLGVDRDTFYDDSRIAIAPTGFCYPGRHERGGDLPPRPECAPLWQTRLRALLPNVGLTLLAGQYAQRTYLGARRKSSLTETVRAWREYGPEYLPTPHPSWRVNNWLKNNAWFDEEVLPELRARVRELVG
jgi:uracil-DNA glycosylase